MAYKKYIYRNGKKYGPYYYKSFRDKDGKVKNIYVKAPAKSKAKKPVVKKKAKKRMSKQSKNKAMKFSYGNKSIIAVLGVLLFLFLIFNKAIGFTVAEKGINININLTINAGILVIIALCIIIFMHHDKISKKNFKKMKKKVKKVNKKLSEKRVSLPTILIIVIALVLMVVMFKSYTGLSIFNEKINDSSEHSAPLNTELSILLMRNMMVNDVVMVGIVGLFFLAIYQLNQVKKTK